MLSSCAFYETNAFTLRNLYRCPKLMTKNNSPWCPSHDDVLRNSGTARRSVANPLGMECYESVLSGNRLAARTLCILWVCAALGVWWLLEQPQNSWMQELPCFQDFMACVTCYRHRFCMRDYGGKSEKPTWLYSGFLIQIGTG